VTVAAPNVLLLDEQAVSEALRGKDVDIVGQVRSAYISFDLGESIAPQSAFMRFDKDRPDRIIALPAATPEASGIKWIASYPSNIERGLNRASAIIVLNSPCNGYPIAIMEGALISAVRTAASAALAVDLLHTVDEREPIGLVGSGRINFEVARVLTALHPRWREVVVFDLCAANVDRFEAAMAAVRPGVRVRRVDSVARVCERTSLIAIATSAIEPHIESLGSAGPGSTVLNLSLRDLAPHLLLDSQNFVDDAQHAVTHGTSLGAASLLAPHGELLVSTLADVLAGRCVRDRQQRAVFGPFGLGVLDIAVASLVEREARARGLGTQLPPLSRAPWYA
jgi:N-[(2S)-2-amino-2-carboxyethyl]-L-glutamate dehydrogenase